MSLYCNSFIKQSDTDVIFTQKHTLQVKQGLKKIRLQGTYFLVQFNCYLPLIVFHSKINYTNVGVLPHYHRTSEK